MSILRCKVFVFLKYVYDHLQAHQKSSVNFFDVLFRLNVSRYKRYSSNLFEVLIQTEKYCISEYDQYIDGV